MFCDHPPVLEIDPILFFISRCIPTRRLAEGVYEINHFGMSNWPAATSDDEYLYGVCDNYQQVLEHHKDIRDSAEPYVLTVTPLIKSEQSPNGGWRWHKWGEYIGTKKPEHEYLYNEGPDIEKVYVYHIYKILRLQTQ